MITKEQVLDALSLLGNEPDEIAQHLFDKGCLARYCQGTAKIPWAENCPVAVYLQQQFPGKYVQANSTIRIGIDATETPTLLREFMHRFDTGEYPFLYAANEEQTNK